MAKKKLPQHEVIENERIVRKYIRRDGGFRKGITTADKKTAVAALRRLGRTKLEWDRTLELHMINTKSIVKPKIN